jgi:hypothetical protein
MFFPSFFLGIMDKFIIMNVHDAALKKNPKKIPNFSPFFPLPYEKKSMLKSMN